MADAVKIRIQADAKQAKGELKGLGRGFADMAGKAKKANADALLLAGAVTAVAAAAVAAGVAVIANARDVAKMGDQIAKTARIVGVSGEQFQVLSFAAERSGINISDVANGMKKLARSMFDAQHGSKQIADTFEGMGIEFEDANGKLRPSIDVLRDVADRMKAVGVTSQTTAEAQVVLGRSGANLTNLLLAGSAGLDDYEDRLKSLNGVMSDDLLASSEAFEDAMTDLDIAAKGLRFQLAEGLLPVMTNFVNAMAFGVSKASPFVSLLNSIASASARAAAALTKMLGSLPPPLLAALYAGKLAGGLVKGVAAGPDGSDLPDLPGLAVPSHLQPGSNGGPAVAVGKAGDPAPKSLLDESLARWDDFLGQRLETFDQNSDALLSSELERLDMEMAAEVAHDAHLASLAAQRQAREERDAEQRQQWAAQTRDIETQNAASAFGAVAHFAELGQQAVEDSYFGQTRAGKIAAKVLFATTKAAALAQAVVQTALGITNGLATPPAPLGAALAVAAGIAGAVQIGTIAATTIQGVADAGLAPGALRAAGLNRHTAIAVGPDEAVIDPRGTSEITKMLNLQRRQMEMGAMTSANSAPAAAPIYLDGRRMTEGLRPHMTADLEGGNDFRRNVRVAGAR